MNKVFWQTIWHLHGKKYNTVRSLGPKWCISQQWGRPWQKERVFQRFGDSINLTISDPQEVHLGEENTITAAEIFLAVVEAGKTAGYD